MNCPAWHVMSQLVAALFEDLPAEQSVHGGIPSCEYVPAWHGLGVQVYEYAGVVMVPLP